MHGGDFYHGEKSMTLDRRATSRWSSSRRAARRWSEAQGRAQAGEVIDSMFMSKKALCAFYEREIDDARKYGVMFSLHVKATMMKVSHPIVFGHCVRIFYKDAFEKHAELFERLGVNVNNGMVDLYNKLASCRTRSARRSCATSRLPRAPAELAMVDSAKGITNFHSPSDVIVDASMPAMIRAGGKMYGADGR
jgi:isocitrate dehydrogenase